MVIQERWLKCLHKKFREENEMAEQQIEVLLEEMLEQQTEVFPKEEEQTQKFYEVDICFVTAGAERRAKGCLVQKNRRDEDGDWKIEYQFEDLLKIESREIFINDNQEKFYCSEK